MTQSKTKVFTTQHETTMTCTLVAPLQNFTLMF